MKYDDKSFRSALGRVRGLGSARNGTQHWWIQRLISLVLIPLGIYFCTTFFQNVIEGGYKEAIVWIRSPYTSTLLILFLLTTLHHTASGIQVVVEDYVHCEKVKLLSIFFVKLICASFAILGTLAIVKILFGV